MNITPRFHLLRKQSTTPTAIQTRIRHKKKLLIYGVGLSIHPSIWDTETQRPTTDKKKLAQHPSYKFRAQAVAKRIEKIIQAIEEYILRCELDGSQFSLSALKDHLDTVFERTTEGNKESKTLNEYIESYIQDMEEGIRTNDRGRRFAQGTIKNYKGFQTQFDAFQTYKGRKLDFEGITLKFYNQFVAYFNEKKYSPNTIGRHIKTLKAIMRAALEEGYHNNREFTRRKFITIKTDVRAVYLTSKELKALHDYELSDNKDYELVRNVFLCGCYTGMRFSDYSRISKEHIKDHGKYKAIDMKTKKTGKRVIVPIRPELEEILKSYDWNLPKTVEQTVNKNIKKIAALVGIDESIEVETFENGHMTIQNVPKWSQITTHTARRTGITLMYNDGVKPTDIMKISSHTTEKNFRKYLKQGERETADKVSKNKFFKSSKLKAVK